MMFRGVKFLLPLNGYDDSLLTPLCLFRVQTMVRNFNAGSDSERFFCLCQCECLQCVQSLAQLLALSF